MKEKEKNPSDTGVQIYFLLAPGKTPDTCSENLSDAYDQCVENKLDSTWISTDKALAKKPVKTVRFFFCFFGSSRKPRQL